MCPTTGGTTKQISSTICRFDCCNCLQIFCSDNLSKVSNPITVDKHSRVVHDCRCPNIRKCSSLNIQVKVWEWIWPKHTYPEFRLLVVTLVWWLISASDMYELLPVGYQYSHFLHLGQINYLNVSFSHYSIDDDAELWKLGAFVCFREHCVPRDSNRWLVNVWRINRLSRIYF